MPSRLGRARRALTWVALALTLMLLWTWLSSRWWQLRGYVHWGSFGWTYGVAGGAWWMEYVEPPPPHQRPARTGGLSAHAIGSQWRWLPECSWDYPPLASGWSGLIATAAVPLWIPLVLIAPPTALLARRELRDRRAARRARMNQCIGCGYALADLQPDSPCPECGRLQT